MSKSKLQKNAWTGIVRDGLGSKWLSIWIAAIIAGTVRLVITLFLDGATGYNLVMCALNVVTMGFVVWQAQLARQKQEGKYLRHLAVYCLVLMILTIVCAGILALLVGGMLLVRRNPEAASYLAEQQSAFTVLSITLLMTAAMAVYSGLTRKALLQADRMLDGTAQPKNRFLPVAVAAFVMVAVMAVFDLFQNGNSALWNTILSFVIGVVHYSSLGMLFLQASHAWNRANE